MPATEVKGRHGVPQAFRLIDHADLSCPAADTAACGRGVRCHIEQHTLLATREASALRAYCLGDHTLCPTWRRDKETEWAEQTNRPLLDSTGDFRVPAPEDKA